MSDEYYNHSDLIGWGDDGPLVNLVAKLAKILEKDPDASVSREPDYEGGYDIWVRWSVKKTPEDIAREQAEEAARAQRCKIEREAQERATLAALKAKYGD